MQRPLSIGIMARGLSEPVGGVKHFIADIIDALLRVDQHNRYYLFYNGEAYRRGHTQAEEIVTPCSSKLVYDHLLFPRVARRYPLDLIYCPKNVRPLGLKVPTVVTIHDLLYFAIPDKIAMNEYRLLDTLYMRLFIPRSIRKSAKVHVISENTREDFIRLFPDQAHKVTTALLGTGGFAREPMDQATVARRLRDLGVTGPYIFYSGTLTKRKNIALLIRALAETNLPHRLVVTGGGNERNEPIDKLLREVGLSERVDRLGTVSADDLRALYKGAAMYVYPSMYEGFGLPVLEAMAVGCPVICSNAASLPEVAGDAAHLIDPTDVAGLARALNKLVDDPVYRAGLVEKGLQRAATLSYDQTAAKLVTLFEAAVTG